MIEAVIIAIHGITDNRNYDTFSLIPRQTTPKTQENVQGDTPRGRITTQRSALSCSKTEGYRIQPSFDAVANPSYERPRYTGSPKDTTDVMAGGQPTTITDCGQVATSTPSQVLRRQK